MPDNVIYKYHLFFLCIFAVFAGIIYSNTFHAPFVFDDYDNIVNNPFIKISELSYQQLFDSAFSSIHSFRPLANLSFALNYYFGGEQVIGFHIVNIIIHFINSILVYCISFVLLTAVFRPASSHKTDISIRSIMLIAFMTAGIFLAHPVQVQSVTYIVQRMNILSALFCFLAIYLYLRGRLDSKYPDNWLFYLFTVLSWCLALSSKQNAAILPVLILLIEWVINPELFSRLKKQTIFIFVIAIILMSLVSLIYLGADPVGRILADYQFREFTLIERLLTESRVIFFYLGLILFPLPDNFNLLHAFTISTSIINPVTTLLSIFGIILLVYMSVRYRKSSRLFSFAIFWLLFCLVIESSIIGLEIVFEHRMYMPMFGVALLISWLTYLLFREKYIYFSVFIAGIFIFLGSATYVRNSVWATETSLWMDVVKKNPESVRGNYNLAKSFQSSNKFTEAVAYYQKAIKLNPNYVPAYNNLGMIFLQEGLHSQALDYFLVAIELDSNNPDGYVNIAAAFYEMRNIEQALNYINNALEKDRVHPKGLFLLASIQQEQGNFTDAETNYRKSLLYLRDQPMALNNLGVLMMRKGEITTAIDLFSEAINLTPDSSLAYFNLGYAYLDSANVPEACKIFSAGLEYSPNETAIQAEIQRHCR